MAKAADIGTGIGGIWVTAAKMMGRGKINGNPWRGLVVKVNLETPIAIAETV